MCKTRTDGRIMCEVVLPAVLVLATLCTDSAPAAPDPGQPTEPPRIAFIEPEPGPISPCALDAAAGRNGPPAATADPNRGQEYDWVAEGMPVFSSDARPAAYADQKAPKGLVIVAGQNDQQRDWIAEDMPVFRPEWNQPEHAAWKAPRWLTVMEGLAGLEYDRLGARLVAQDGREVTNEARKGGKWLVIMDRPEGPEHDVIVKGGDLVGFRAGATLEFLVVGNDTLYRLQCVPLAAPPTEAAAKAPANNDIVIPRVR